MGLIAQSTLLKKISVGSKVKHENIYESIYTYIQSKIKLRNGPFLVVQWLRLHLPMLGVGVRSMVRELRSHMTLDQKTKYKTDPILQQIQ